MLGKLSLMLMLVSGILAQESAPSYKNPPSNTKAAKDHDATMYCQVEDKGKSNLYWHCNSNNGNSDITVGPNENTNPALSKYIIDNSGASIGQYNLVITNVTDLDAGVCSCIVATGDGNAMEAGADIKVMPSAMNPDAPICDIDKTRTPGRAAETFTADDTVELTCESSDGIPLASIHWEIVREGNNGIGIKILSSITTTLNTITAVADYKITAHDNGAYFKCVQTHPLLVNTQMCSPPDTKVGSQSTPLKVLYPPVLRFVPSSLKVTPLETTRETLRCEYDANPQLDTGPSIRHKPADSRDTLNINFTIPGKEDSVDLILDQDDNGKVLECVATNEIGTSVITMKIESTGLLPTWILIIIIGGGGFILFFIIALVCCICFCGGDEKDQHSVSRSRPGTFQGSEMGMDDSYAYGGESEGYTDGYDEHDPGMVNINEFDGGMEMKGDYETGENHGYVDDEHDYVGDDDIPPAPPLQPQSSSRTYDQVPMD